MIPNRPADNACNFCRIAQGLEPAEVVCAERDWLAFFPLHPATPGHTLIIPRVHVVDLWDIDPALGTELMAALDDPHAVGLTVYRPSAASWMPRYDRTEFFWSYQDGLKTLHIEEVATEAPIGQLSDDYVLTRYVHTIRDVTVHAFVHLDGAVKVYARNAWPQRFAQQLPAAAKVKTKLKMFRIDGAIPDDEWSKLVSLYFQSNCLVPEYLNPAFEREG